MKESTSREKVLKAIRDALVNPMMPPYVDEDYSDRIYIRPEIEYDEVIFAEALARVGGQFVYSANENEFAENIREFLAARDNPCLHCYEDILQKILNSNNIFCFNAREELSTCEMGITTCEFLIARLGSIMVSSNQGCGRRGLFWPDIHLVIAWKDQLVYDLKHGFAALNQKYKEKGIPSMITTITGPSRTADIEKTLVMGAHGPKELIVFFIDAPYDDEV
ncbi:MAG: LutC/YkgG family protein [Bacteroidota bacterium]